MARPVTVTEPRPAAAGAAAGLVLGGRRGTAADLRGRRAGRHTEPARARNVVCDPPVNPKQAWPQEPLARSN